MSGKKSSLGKTSSSWASVMKKPSVVAQSTPPKTLSSLSHTGSQETGFRRPTVSVCGARRKTGWGRRSRNEQPEDEPNSLP
jgi:hypothetical protein